MHDGPHTGFVKNDSHDLIYKFRLDSASSVEVSNPRRIFAISWILSAESLRKGQLAILSKTQGAIKNKKINPNAKNLICLAAFFVFSFTGSRYAKQDIINIKAAIV